MEDQLQEQKIMKKELKRGLIKNVEKILQYTVPGYIIALKYQ